jgi:tetratricopeptide (TPR) repeat protein
LTREQAERMGAPRAIALCQCLSGALDFQVGAWTAAERDLREAIERYRGIGAASGEALSLQRLGVLLTARGQLDEALIVLDEGVVVAERAIMRSHCLTRLQASLARNRLAADDLDGAREAIATGDLHAARHGHCVTCNALLLPEAVRVALRSGYVDDADARTHALEMAADEFGSQAWRAMARMSRGRVLAAQGRRTEAATAFADARVAWTAVDASYDAARCAAEEARLSGDETLGTQAQTTFRGLGAPVGELG